MMSSIDTGRMVAVDGSRWPKVLGVISLIYALGGLLCQVGMGAWSVLSGMLMRMGGMDVELPRVVQVTTLVMAGLTFCLGLYMLAGAIALLRRQRSGPAMLRKWAMLRLVLLLVACGVTIASMPAMMDFQREIVVSQNEQYREAGMEQRVQPIPSDEQLHRQSMMQLAIMTGVVALYPLFLGYYLTRRRIVDQIDQWE